MNLQIVKTENYPWDNKMTELIHSLTENEDYLKGAYEFKQKIDKLRILPCAHQIGDYVKVLFITDSKITCKIRKVIFDFSSVYYDITLDIPIPTEEEKDRVYIKRLYNIEACLVEKIEVNE